MQNEQIFHILLPSFVIVPVCRLPRWSPVFLYPLLILQISPSVPVYSSETSAKLRFYVASHLHYMKVFTFSVFTVETHIPFAICILGETYYLLWRCYPPPTFSRFTCLFFHSTQTQMGNSLYCIFHVFRGLVFALSSLTLPYGWIPIKITRVGVMSYCMYYYYHILYWHAMQFKCNMLFLVEF